jgi:hypothetical protein
MMMAVTSAARRGGQIGRYGFKIHSAFPFFFLAHYSYNLRHWIFQYQYQSLGANICYTVSINQVSYWPGG